MTLSVHRTAIVTLLITLERTRFERAPTVLQTDTSSTLLERYEANFAVIMLVIDRPLMSFLSLCIFTLPIVSIFVDPETGL